MIDTVVIDDGSSQVIACWMENGKIRHSVSLTKVVEGLRPSNGGAGVHSGSWFAGDTPYTMDDDFRDSVATNNQHYQHSKVNRIVVHETLRRIGYGGKDVNVVTTLPVNLYFNKDMLANREMIKRKQDNTLADIKHADDLPHANIIKNIVRPEAIPAFYDLALDDNLNPVLNYDRVLIVDIGGTTTDVTSMNGRRGTIEKTDAIKCGVFDIKTNLSNQIVDGVNVRSISDHMLDKCLRSGLYMGKDISAQITTAAAPVVDKIASKLFAFDEEAAEFDAVIYVGGGAALIGDTVGHHYGGNTVIPDEPHLCLARGIMKLILLEEKNGKNH